MTRAGRPRTRELKAYHHAEITRRHLLLGETETIIAKDLRISQSQVATDLQALYKEWRDEARENVAHQRAVEIRRLRAIEVEASGAWFRSIGPEETQIADQVEESMVAPEGEGSPAPMRHRYHARTTTRNRTGDSRHLDVMLRSIDLRMRLIGGYPAPGVEAVASAVDPTASALITKTNDLTDRYTEALMRLRPAERSRVIDRFHRALVDMDYVNYKLLGVPRVYPPDPGDEDPEGPPPNVVIVDGQVRYLDED